MGDGTFVVIEGIDGAGTTTQCELLATRLRAERRLVHVTREPSTGPVGSMIRLALTHRLVLPLTHRSETLALLFAADRLDHVASEIDPLVRDGYVVISDRYDLSSLAYQSATGAGASRDRVPWIRELNRHARRPDLTIVLDVSHEVAASRRRQRGGAAELFDDEDLQRALVDAYKGAEALVPGDRVAHVDGNRDKAEVAAEVSAAVIAYLSGAPRSV